MNVNKHLAKSQALFPQFLSILKLMFSKVTKMKRLVSGCLRKHIITPSRLPSLSRPVILLAWGCYLELQFNDLERVRSFISTHALGGPEGNYSKDGLYTHLQLAKAGIPPGGEQIICQQKVTLAL